MELEPTAIPEVILIKPRMFEDARGYFQETWNTERYAKAGINAEFVQDNLSHSIKGVLRGLHYQSQHAQGKLVQVLSGEIFDVAVDLRRSSPTFKRWVGLRLSSQGGRQIWVPPGFAHGFYVLSDRATVLYKCTDIYSPAHEHTIIWNDPELKIEWPITGGRQPLMSDKDAQGKRLSDVWHFP